jgi:hypothetical protein
MKFEKLRPIYSRPLVFEQYTGIEKIRQEKDNKDE